jgi:hypothetical protein
MPSRSRPAARLLLGGLALVLAACGTPERGTANRAPAPGAPLAVVHKSADCACCGGHSDHLREHGYHVDEILYDDPQVLADFKTEHGVPEAQRSCHTTLVDSYVVEGHMPVEEIDLLLAERPAIDGIALAGMPAGSPGMPGPKTVDWTIWALTDGLATIHAVR